MRIVITGAAGKIGRAMVNELSAAHELCLLDRAPVSDSRSRVVDLSRSPRRAPWPARLWLSSPPAPWTATFEGADVLLHLAGQPNWEAPWEEVLQDNVQATWNVVQAALSRGVRRIVFASSTWAVKALERAWAPACYAPDGPKIGSDAAPRPLTPYGFSKALGEHMGQALVDEGRLHSFLAVRIGHHEPTPPRVEEIRRLWVGTDDLRRMLRRTVEVRAQGFHVLYGISAQLTNPYDLTYTRNLLDWSPEQRS
jgi:nucleoside-diphosphate-sugar epimerase